MRLVITGAGGWLARELALQAHKVGIKTLGISSNPDVCKAAYDDVALPSSIEVSLFDPDDILVHCAFSRKSIPQKLSVSLDYAKRVFLAAGHAHISGIVNVSSQSVYGSSSKDADENAPLCPDYPYALAKVASEEILSGIMLAMGQDELCYTNVRLASLIGVANGKAPSNILYKFIQKAISDEPITIVGGDQKFSFLNVKDAARGLLELCTLNPLRWHHVYNLGTGCQTSITEMAKLVQFVVLQRCGVHAAHIEIDEKADYQAIDVGMNCELLYSSLQWKPLISFEETVEETVEYCMKTSGCNVKG